MRRPHAGAVLTAVALALLVPAALVIARDVIGTKRGDRLNGTSKPDTS